MRRPGLRRTPALLLVGALAASGWGSVAAANDELTDLGEAGVQYETLLLDNGMRFLLVPRPEMTSVAGGWVAHVGSANERPGITGLAHLFEHMLFKGSTTVGTTDIARDLEIIAEQEDVQEKIRAIYGDLRRQARQGAFDDPYAAENRTPELIDLEQQFGELVEQQRQVMVKDEFDQLYTEQGATFMNAFTSNDVTVYFINVPANKLELWFWMESERLLNPVFREFYAERDVVYEERRLRTESTPTGKFDELVNSMFWQSHPYSWPIVGWPSDLETISKAQADAFFDTYYAPNNLTAVLVGNFDIADVEQLAGRYFGRLERGAVEPPDVVTLEMPQVAEKRMNGECDCQPQIEVRYHTVAFQHPDSYALDVLGGLLSGRAGRLYERLVDGSEVASAASARQSSDKYAGYFSFSADTKGDAAPEDLEEGWYAVLSDLRENPVGDEELRRVKNVLLADAFRSLQNPFFLMVQLALYDGLGDPSYLNTVTERTEAVTAGDVQRVVKKYFTAENRLVATYRRKAGTQAEEVPPELTEISAEMRQSVIAQGREIDNIEDPAMVRQFLQQVEQRAGSMPADMEGVGRYLLRKLQERLAELEGASASEEN